MWMQVADAEAWDAALRALPSPHLLQSWAWGEFKSRWGWTAERWLLRDTFGEPRAAAQVLMRRIRRLPVCVLYVPKGPSVANEDVFDAALELLEQRARKNRAIWVKIDGDPATGGRMALNHRRALLVARGWRYSPVQVQFRNTMHTDLCQSDEALLMAMKPKTRYNVRLAERRGVRVRVITPIGDADARLLYAMYAETAQRDGFIIREPAYYFDAWQSLGGVAFIAEYDGQPLAGLVLLRFGERAWYFYGMSRTVGREHMPSYVLQWAAMRWARDHGCALYDWWGAPDQRDASDPMWGVYRFKEGFGARFVEGLGAWDYAPSSFAYRVYLKLASRVIRSGLT